MFGTVARMKFKPGAYETMQGLMEGFEQRQVKGFVFNVVYRSQTDPNETWLVVGFEDEASYRANAEDPQTNEMAQQYQQLLAAPPEWHDGEIVTMTRAEDQASS
jgi:quinol monooxygenase YgiN